VTSAKKKEKPSADDHLPRGDNWCEACRSHSHFTCFDTDLDLVAAAPLVALHDADLAVNGEAAA
jgi:hypothetical protein